MASCGTHTPVQSATQHWIYPVHFYRALQSCAEDRGTSSRQKRRPNRKYKDQFDTLILRSAVRQDTYSVLDATVHHLSKRYKPRVASCRVRDRRQHSLTTKWDRVLLRAPGQGNKESYLTTAQSTRSLRMHKHGAENRRQRVPSRKRTFPST